MRTQDRCPEHETRKGRENSGRSRQRRQRHYAFAQFNVGTDRKTILTIAVANGTVLRSLRCCTIRRLAVRTVSDSCVDMDVNPKIGGRCVKTYVQIIRSSSQCCSDRIKRRSERRGLIEALECERWSERDAHALRRHKVEQDHD
jgi:hypothetical protein